MPSVCGCAADAGDGGQNTGDIRDPGPLWRTVREVGVKTLAETAKDLEVAAWMTEALVRSHGLAGLTSGAQSHGRFGGKVLGRTVPAAGRLWNGNARRAGDRIEWA